MNQEQLNIITEAWCMASAESLGDYELIVEPSSFNDTVIISVKNNNIKNIGLPWEYTKNHYSAKEKAKAVISLLELIIENYDKWMDDEKDYHADKLAEKGDNDYKEKLEND